MLNLNYQIFGEGLVNIVVEMGLGSCIGEWEPLAGLLAKENHTVLVYERAGINHSEASAEKRKPQQIAEELHELLKSIPHAEKIIILAHSQGGLYAQQFCRLYPDIVEKLILLDPLSASDNEFKEKLSVEEYKKSGVDKILNFKIMYRLARLKLGFITKAMLKKAPPFYYYHSFTKEETEDILNCVKNPVHAQTVIEEYELAHMDENIKHLQSKGQFPDIPLILVTHASNLAIQENMLFGNNTKEFAEKVENMWQQIMKEYLTFSTASQWISATKSTHYIHLTEPELVEDLVSKKV